jgi:thioredoxin reductase (NADPH)
MTIPVLMAVDGDPESLGTLDDTLRRRYGQDYLVISDASAAAALGRLQELRAAGREVALVMAGAAMTAPPAAEFLAQARSIAPAAKRVLVVPRGGPAAPSLGVPVPLVQDRQAATPVLRAIAHGMIDTYLPAPGAGRDEGFHRGVSELLEEWAHDATPAVPAVRIIAEQQSAHAHQLRDVLARNGIPYLFHAAESADGQSWLARAGQDGSTLPVVVTYSGEVLVAPSRDQVAAVFGLASLPAGIVDVAVVGAGPAGLSAAVYAASEGLSTLLLEREAFGGQAGSSSLIRNYLGFPRGISGASLATRDGHGFILTGGDLPGRRDPPASPAPSRSLETSLPGVFAAGDVRHGSIKRVASAVGEGSIATTQMTRYLQDQAGNS